MKDDNKTKKQLLHELTELRSQNAALKESESAEKYRSLVENIKDVIYELDSQGVVLYISPAVRDMLVFDSTEIIGRNFTELVYEDDLSRLEEWFSELRKCRESPSEYRFSDKSGQLRWAQTRVRPIMEDGQFKGARGILIDVTEQKRTEKTLRESEEKYRRVFENSIMGISQTLRDGRLIAVNNAYAKMYGYANAEEMMTEVSSVGPLYANPEEWEDVLRILTEKGVMEPREITVIRRDGIRFTVLAGAREIKDFQGNLLYYQAEQIDITERKQADEALRESEIRYRELFNNMGSGVSVYETPNNGENFVFKEYNAAAEMLDKTSREQVIGRSVVDVFPGVKDFGIFDIFQRVYRTGKAERFPLTFYKDEKISGWRENYIYKLPSGEIVAVYEDVTERKRAEEELKESKALIEAVVENVPLMIFLKEAIDLRFVIFNRAGEELLGHDRRDLIGKNNLDLFPPEQAAHFMAKDREVLDGKVGMLDIPEEPILTARKGQRLLHTRKVCIRGPDGATKFLLGISEDITERKRAEEALRESEENFRRSLDESPLGISIVSEKGEIFYANRAILDFFGYESIEELRETPVTKRYTESNYAEFLDRKEKRRLHADDPSDYEIDIVRKDGEVRHLQAWRRRVLWNGKEHYQVIYRDITDGKRAEKQLQDTLESLRKAIGTTIQVMVSAVESRDPYTAGHQIRSANLARAIATEMGLPQDRIEGIRMAGSIHDIGKISIPAEILSKPTKLSELEFSLIKEHAQKGYEMLKDVESPWPLAEIVYQHHERMDGSGYPRNLKGEKILIEARVLAVADVVEAMASYRPYRPGLGIDTALNEIEKNRGTIYDKTVVDACLRLFREKGYKFEGT